MDFFTTDRPLSLPRLQEAIGRLARTKGLFEAAEPSGRQFGFQLTGPRDAPPAGAQAAGSPWARIVFIADIGALSTADSDPP